MAKRDVVIRISAEDMASGVISRIRGNFVEMAGAVASGEAIYNGITGAAGKFYALISSSIKDALEAERGNAQLARALSSVGNSSRTAYNEMSDFAGSMAELSAQDDDAIKSVMTLLVNIGKLSGSSLKDATRATLDLAAATGKDLNEAAMAVAKAATGNATALQKMGITIGDNVKPGQEFAEVLKKINEQMGGAAQTEADTYAGKIRNAANAWGDFKKSLGEWFLQEFKLGGLFDDLAKVLRERSAAITNGPGIDAQITALERLAKIDVMSYGGQVHTGVLTPDAQKWADALPQIRQYTEEIKRLADVAGVSEKRLGDFFARSINPASAEDTLSALNGIRLYYAEQAKKIAEKDKTTQERLAQEKADAIRKAEDEAAKKRLAAQEAAAREAERIYQESVKRQMGMIETAFAPTMQDIEDQLDVALTMAGTDADRGLVAKLLFGNMRPEDLRKALDAVLSGLDKRFAGSQQQSPLGASGAGLPSPTLSENAAFIEATSGTMEKFLRQLKSATGETKKMADQWTSTKDIADEIGTRSMRTIADGIHGILSGTMSLGEAIQSIFDGVIDAIEQAIAEYIAAQIVTGILGLFNAGGMVVPRAQRAAVGWTVPGPDRSTDMVPAILTPGERVLSRSEAERYAAGMSGGGRAAISLNLTVWDKRRAAAEIVDEIDTLVSRRGYRLAVGRA